MYIDKENTFMLKQNISAAFNSDVVQNGNGGDAYEALWLYVLVNTVLSGAATVKLETADTENMSGAVTVGTYTLPAQAGSKVAVRLPSGLKKYLRLNVSGITSGAVSGFLTPDVKIG